MAVVETPKSELRQNNTHIGIDWENDLSQTLDRGLVGGSDASAACGRESELSEWQWSKFRERTASRKFRVPQQDLGEGGSKPG